MDAERAYDFAGTHLPIYFGFLGHVTDQLMAVRQRVAAFGPGLALAQPLVAPFLLNDQHVADIEIGVASGRPACVAMRGAHGQPLTGALMRSLPLGTIVTQVADQNTYRVFRTKRGRYVGAYYSDAFEGMLGFEEDLKELRDEINDKRRTLDDDFLDRVAEVYRDATARRESPAKALVEQLGPVSRGTARRWVMHARWAGKLGSAPGRGRSGEAVVAVSPLKTERT
jgi:hypothetical protein